MSWFSKFVSTPKRGEPRPPAGNSADGIYLDALGAAMLTSLAQLERAAIDLELFRARLADICRDLGMEPAEPDQLLQQLRALDAESQRRFAMAIKGLDDAPTRNALDA